MPLKLVLRSSPVSRATRKERLGRSERSKMAESHRASRRRASTESSRLPEEPRFDGFPWPLRLVERPHESLLIVECRDESRPFVIVQFQAQSWLALPGKLGDGAGANYRHRYR